ncbi:hypothetical protein PV08_07970 [Exophiala spinifera]|uniref:Zn(2)-C6 fungal-type domain-containing protein n=1 Tax=Exophiala spinifera TaxID=91928 RepID=A0A0D2B1H3_9EURO|nr:uncharacterized protein PV08_07970 [Exophiala spinifera]KIW12783.1 hypothetical protein PV08_07970 [Exophiala spinifera]
MDNPSAVRRPPKRTTEACEPCRRKKSRCPGEKPRCSHCARLGHNCSYSSGSRGRERGSQDSIAAPSRDQEGVRFSQSALFTDNATTARLNALEAGLAQIQNLLRHQSQDQHATHDLSLSESPANGGLSDSIGQSDSVRQERGDRDTPPLPPKPVVEAAVDVYMKFCNFQPLPLFSPQNWRDSFASWDVELLLSIVASALRFKDRWDLGINILDVDKRQYAAAAQKLVMHKVSYGPVDVSTIQCLCILSLNEFHDGYTARAGVFSSLAMELAQSGGLASEHYRSWPEDVYEERRRCFWSLNLLKNLHGNWSGSFSFLTGDYTPKFPKSPDLPIGPTTGSSQVTPDVNVSGTGIISYTVQMSALWSRTARYARRRSQRREIVCWEQNSEFSSITAQLMELDAKCPPEYRYRMARFRDQDPARLQQARHFWSPWLLTKFLYHTILCLLNHPLILSLRLRNFGADGVPEVFLRQTDDLIKNHTAWVVRLIDEVNATSFRLSDPYIAYCVSVVATIFLQQSYAEDAETRSSKQKNFDKCLNFIQNLGAYWPRVSEMASKVEQFANVVATSYHNSSSASIGSGRRVAIDLTHFWAIIESCFISELPTGSDPYFGPSLTLHRPTFNFSEVLDDTLLPTPTDFNASAQTVSGDTPVSLAMANNLVPNIDQASMRLANPVSQQQPQPLMDDCFSVLAHSYFAQGQDFANMDDWWYSTAVLQDPC